MPISVRVFCISLLLQKSALNLPDQQVALVLAVAAVEAAVRAQRRGGRRGRGRCAGSPTGSLAM